MTIDWSLRFGDIVSFLGFALGGLSVIFMMKSDIRALALKLGFLEEEVEKQSARIGELGNVLMVMGRYEERMGALRRDMDDLKHGRGYIKDK
jgi:hypothetical protein